MTDLLETLKQAGKHTARLTEAMNRAGVSTWSDLASIDRLCAVRDAIADTTNSGSVYAAKLAAILGRYEDQIELPRGWRKCLSIKAATSQQTYMTLDDIRKLFDYEAKSEGEKFVQLSAIIELRTGTRVSDAKDLDERNVVEGMLCYVSQKTKVEAYIPCSNELLTALKMRRAMNIPEYTDEGYNKALKRILGDARVVDEVKLFRRGEYREEEKCDAISSHTLRRTFCTQLHLSGEDVIDIMSWAGHSSVEMTKRYIRARRMPGAARWNYFEVIDKMIAAKYSIPCSKMAPVENSIRIAN